MSRLLGMALGEMLVVRERLVLEWKQTSIGMDLHVLLTGLRWRLSGYGWVVGMEGC